MKPGSSVVSEGILIFNDKGQVVVASPDANRLFDYEKGGLSNLFATNIFADGLSVIAESQHKVFHRNTQGDTWKKIKGLNKAGNKFSINISLSQFQGGDELFTAAFVAKTVVKKKNAKKSIKENSSEPIFLILDRNSNISLINPFGCEFLGFKDETFNGLNWFDHFLPVDQTAQLKTILEQAFLTGVMEDYESPVLCLTGESYIVRWSTYAIYNSAGEPIGTVNAGIDTGKKKARRNMMHTTRIDKLNKQLELNAKKQNSELITLLKDLETTNRNLQEQITKRKETEQKLMMFQRLYDTMIHNFPDGVIGILNKEMEYILIDGKELNEIDLPALGLHGRKNKNHNPELAEETINKIKKAFDGENISFEVNTNDRSYSITAVPLPDGENQINEILCVLKNVTEKNRVESVLLKALEKEKELGELKSRFVTMACHEFKTPLATILSSTFLLENYSGEAYDSEKLLYSNRIRRSVNNLNTILNEFLLIESQNGNDVKISPTLIDIPKYVSEVLLEVEPLRKQGQIVSYHHSGNQEKIKMDQHLLWSILTNLINNALKYSRQNDKIEVTTTIEDGLLTISVMDNGIGIPAEEHPHVFERFYRAPNALNYEGTGLGLHIVRKNVRLLKGSISFTSEIEKGTEFRVILPLLTNVIMEKIN